MLVTKLDIPASFKNLNSDEIINIGICCIYDNINKDMVSNILSKRIPNVTERESVLSGISYDNIMDFYETLHSQKSIDYKRTVIFLIDMQSNKFIIKQ